MRLIKYEGSKPKKSEVPLTTDWKNAKMLRAHSITGAVKKILQKSNSYDVVKVNIIGEPSTGKSTLAETLAHLCHKMSTMPFTVKKFGKDELFDFENVLKTLQPTNHVLIFDDISFMKALGGQKKVSRVEQTFTEIRHLPGGQDVKIIAIFNFHYNMAVSKYLRQSNFFFWTTIGSSEDENTLGIVGKRNKRKLDRFRDIENQASSEPNIFSIRLGKKGKFDYVWRKPFAPVLFWDKSDLVLKVFPERKWIDTVCSNCFNAKPTNKKQTFDITTMDQDMRKTYGIGVIRQAMRIHLFNLGVFTYSKRVKQCMRTIEEWLSNKEFDAEKLADFYDLKSVRTKVGKLPKID